MRNWKHWPTLKTVWNLLFTVAIAIGIIGSLLTDQWEKATFGVVLLILFEVTK